MKSLIHVFCFLLVFCMSFLSSAKAQDILSFHIELPNDRVITGERMIFRPGATTLILLPGINRGFNQEDAIVDELKKNQINFVTFHFSAHPRSVIEAMKLGKTRARFEGLSLEDLVSELNDVIASLRIQSPLVVSLSYSGAVSGLLKKTDFSQVIDVVPLGRQNDGNNFLQSYLDAFQGVSVWNPFVAAWLNQMKELSYQSYWTNQVRNLVPAYPELKTTATFNKVVAAMISLSKAVENYELEKQDFANGPERLFVLAEKEEPALLVRQRAAIQAYHQQRGEAAGVFLVKDAGHVLPVDAERALVEIFKLTIAGQIPSNLDPANEWLISKDGITP